MNGSLAGTGVVDGRYAGAVLVGSFVFDSGGFHLLDAVSVDFGLKLIDIEPAVVFCEPKGLAISKIEEEISYVKRVIWYKKFDAKMHTCIQKHCLIVATTSNHNKQGQIL